jgi:hypothetical protein
MIAIDRHKLHFGPYSTPAYGYGTQLECLECGEVMISKTSRGRIPWPMSIRKGGTSLVLCHDLARAVRHEAACAVAYWFGVSTWTVRKWRRVLGVPSRNEGDRLLKSDYAKGERGALARTAALATAGSPERRAKISAAQRGKPRPAHVVEAVRKAMTGRKLSADHRRKVIGALERHRLRAMAG